jgi:hypothetical protein
MIGKGFIVRPQQRECRLMCRPLLHSYTELRVPVPTVTSIKSDGKDILSVAAGSTFTTARALSVRFGRSANILRPVQSCFVRYDLSKLRAKELRRKAVSRPLLPRPFKLFRMAYPIL